MFNEFLANNGDALAKRERFAVGLRKEKRQTLIADKRRKLTDSKEKKALQDKLEAGTLSR